MSRIRTRNEDPTVMKEFIFDTPDGRELARRILKPLLPFEPHDYIVDGVCRSLDGQDLMALIPTGGGKTGYIFMYMLIMSALANNPALCQPKKIVPKDPAMVAVFPTNGLEEEMELEFKKYAIAINSHTLREARKQGKDLWKIVSEQVSLILLSPEQLSSKPFERLLYHPMFRTRVCALAIDEIHLLDTWGNDFRQVFQQIGYMASHFPSRVVMIALTATLPTGPPMQQVCNFLGLKPGWFHLVHRSNIRPDLRIVIRELTHGIGNHSFPDLLWILDSRRKTMIFCETINISFRVHTYLWNNASLAANCDRKIRIRMYNLLNSPLYNAETRRLFHEDPRAQIITATDSICVGFDPPDVADIVVLGAGAQTPATILQKQGRAGRQKNRVKDLQGILYVTRSEMVAANLANSGDSAATIKNQLNVHTAKFIMAPCKVIEQDNLFSNPSSDVPCLCSTCKKTPQITKTSQCNCSGCSPDTPPLLPAVIKKLVTRSDRLTTNMCQQYSDWLIGTRNKVWKAVDLDTTDIFPPASFLPDRTIKEVLDHLHELQSAADLLVLAGTNNLLVPHINLLWQSVADIKRQISQLRAQKTRQKCNDNGDELAGESDESMAACMGVIRAGLAESCSTPGYQLEQESAVCRPESSTNM
ncbi:hypothetical protein SERLA73DRAFT_69962 [Serpula lacrymans var. lacrymans S7.3]|uniref:DNA 3'-5' helicase n=1 Tax=Serpula lacrymans var. lacrymans (strain S7.3) TaxID=936435 RepID=F8PLH5_SERL3|nr:hypothetical protein SERLA73DRAFT_69962 [Serpula lacrymans var. lacrymans S7.3]